MKKNDILTLEITALTGGGDGIARTGDGMVVFVPNTAVGDVAEVLIIKVKKSYAIGKLYSVITPALSRIPSDCDVSASCGGCVFRHISYEKEIEIKARQVADSLSRIGKIDIAPAVPETAKNINRYRNKVQIPVGKDKFGNVVCGYFAKKSHRIIPFGHCKLVPPVFNDIISAFTAWANDNALTVYDEKSGQGFLRHLYIRRAEVTGEIMAGVVANGEKLPFFEDLLELIKTVCGNNLKSFVFNVNKEDTNVILSDKCITLYGREYITDEICGIKLNISMLSFYQVNHAMAEKLYAEAVRLADVANSTVLDLYCGVGALGLISAKSAKQVYGVEIISAATENAKQNAMLNGIKNAEFICADAAKAAKMFAKRGISPDVVILDPPRKGCDEDLIKTITSDFQPKRVVYVSCNDATLARDCAVFAQNGYSVEYVKPFDLFPRTGHIECACLLSETQK